MEIEIPTVPAGILALLAFFLPYAQAVIQRPTWTSGQKKLVAVVAAVVLAGIAIALYFALTGDVWPDWPVAILLVLVVAQTSYSMVTHDSAKRVEQNVGLT